MIEFSAMQERVLSVLMFFLSSGGEGGTGAGDSDTSAVGGDRGVDVVASDRNVASMDGVV
jgi:hypothetical protein